MTKIERYCLEEKILTLYGQGQTCADIAQIITQELPSIQSISEASVARFLSKVRKERIEQTRIVYEEHIKSVLPGDLQALEEMEHNLLEWHHGRTGPNGPELSLYQRAAFGMQAAKLIDIKLKYSGLLEDPNGAPGAITHPVDLTQYRMDKDKEEEEEDDPRVFTH